MPQKAWSSKRERQYEHIEESLEERGTPKKKAKEIAARTVNKERARAGEAKTSSRLLAHRHLVGPPRRAPLRHEARRRAARRSSSTTRPSDMGIEGRSTDDEGAAPARRRPAQVGDA